MPYQVRAPTHASNLRLETGSGATTRVTHKRFDASGMCPPRAGWFGCPRKLGRYATWPSATVACVELR